MKPPVDINFLYKKERKKVPYIIYYMLLLQLIATTIGICNIYSVREFIFIVRDE